MSMGTNWELSRQPINAARGLAQGLGPSEKRSANLNPGNPIDSQLAAIHFPQRLADAIKLYSDG